MTKLFVLNAQEWATYRSTYNLSDVDLSKTYFGAQNFGGFDLSKINFSESNLIGANLSDANLNGADLTDTLLFCADLQGAHLEGVKGDPNPNQARAKSGAWTFFNMWAFVVGLREGFDNDEALSLASVAATAYLAEDKVDEEDKPDNIEEMEFCGQVVEMIRTGNGRRGYAKRREVKPEIARLISSQNLGGKRAFEALKETFEKLADKYSSDIPKRPVEVYEKVDIKGNCIFKDQIEALAS
jgi:hypothetical protein